MGLLNLRSFYLTQRLTGEDHSALTALTLEEHVRHLVVVGVVVLAGETSIGSALLPWMH